MKSALLISLVLVAFAAMIFGWRQRRGVIGGRIALSKQLWLGWAVYVWFALCPIVAFYVPGYRLLFGLFSLSMWIRGLAELYLMYVRKGWRPAYGIAHNLFSVLLLLVGWMISRPPLTDHRHAALALVVLLSLLLETFYAWRFSEIVRGKTTGDDAVWFADADDPRFRRITQLTALANVPLYTFLGTYLLLTLL